MQRPAHRQLGLLYQTDDRQLSPMQCASVVVQGHTLPSQTFFEPVIAQVEFRHGLLQILVLTLETRHLIGICFPGSIAGQAFLAGLQESPCSSGNTGSG